MVTPREKIVLAYMFDSAISYARETNSDIEFFDHAFSDDEINFVAHEWGNGKVVEPLVAKGFVTCNKSGKVLFTLSGLALGQRVYKFLNG